jgi:putative ABC transport system permease protein
LLTESVVLALLGGVAGALLAQLGGGVLRLTLLPSGVEAGTLTDTRVLLMCGAVALLVGVATGLAPALFAGRSDVAAALKCGAREGALHRSPLRAAMLVTQGALSVVLLVGSGLFVRSLRQAQAVPMGFDPDRVLWVATELRGTDMPDAQYRSLQLRLIERAQSLPGVERAARVLTVPFGPNSGASLFVAGIDSVARLGDFRRQSVSPEYFATMGTRIMRGRGIETQDRQGAPPVMVVSQSMARKLWPGREALGQCVRVGADTMPCTTVVGIAADIKTVSLGDDDPGLLFYSPIDQLGRWPFWRPGLFARTRGEAAAAANTVRRALQGQMPGAAYVKVMPLADQIAPQRRSWEVGATMFTVFGALALLVAAVGLYSVISYSVAQRSQELAVRVALGAQLRDIVRMVVGEGLRTVLLATAIGLGLAWFAARWVGPLLFETSPRDPVVFGGVAALLVAIALVASAIPAVRAARVDPVTALRAD